MYELTYSKPDIVKLGPITSSKKELKDLLKSWFVISLAFGIVLAGGFTAIFTSKLLMSFSISAIAVGTGFVFHELAHKLVAQKYNCWAEFRSFDTMLFLALAMSLFGFVFAAPGAVMITGTISRDQNGKISLAGPMMNILLAISFLGLGFFVAEGFLALLVSYGFFINVWLALFNLLPIGNFDGKKVWRWSKPIWIVSMVAAGALFLLAML